jgi:phenylpyruvate tautomerase PptA (4-oxalocrotonate tautomerase family)
MPFMEITYPQGALSAEARATLAEELTTILLRAERAPDTEFFRNVTWLYTNELPADSVHAAGVPVQAPTFKLDVTTPQGALSDRRRKELVAEATSAIREAAGIPEQEGLRVWVLCHEVAEGSWGAAGNVVEFEALRAAAKAEREKAPA